MIVQNDWLSIIKRKFYFWGAKYFAFYAKQRLQAWNPKVIVITGSVGKTTAFNLLEAQLGTRAFYSYKANSAYGICFNILGLTADKMEESGSSFLTWLRLFTQATRAVKKKLPKQGVYVVECDCDRPGEGEFLANLLEPDIVLWLNSSETHGMYYDRVVREGKFVSQKEAIAYEYGWFLEEAREMVLVNGDSALIGTQLMRVAKGVKILTFAERDYLRKYRVTSEGTAFSFRGSEVKVAQVLPRASWLAIVMVRKVTEMLGARFDESFKKYISAPGRASLLRGIKGITIFDSTYNASPASMVEVVELFKQMKNKSGGGKWMILSQMLEQGNNERVAHEGLAEIVTEALESGEVGRVILTGELLRKWTVPKLEEKGVPFVYLENVAEVCKYLVMNLVGGEMLLFKGRRMLEGVIERLLLYPYRDKEKLPWRGEIYERARKSAFAEIDEGDGTAVEIRRQVEEMRREAEQFERRQKKISDVADRAEKNGQSKKTLVVGQREVGKSKEGDAVGKSGKEVGMTKRQKVNRKLIIVPGWNKDESGFGEIGLKAEEQSIRKELEKEGWKVAILKVPGFLGKKIETAWDLEKYNEWLTARLKERMKAGEEVYLLGHSAGGRVILKYLSEMGEKVTRGARKLRGVILVDSAGLKDERKEAVTRRKLIEKIESENGSNERRLEKGLELVKYVDNWQMRRTWLNLNKEDLGGNLRQIAVRTLLIWGEDDQETPVLMGWQMKQLIAGSQLEVLAETGHRPQTERRGEFMAILREFMK